jgi:hypothetical protein
LKDPKTPVSGLPELAETDLEDQNRDTDDKRGKEVRDEEAPPPYSTERAGNARHSREPTAALRLQSRDGWTKRRRHFAWVFTMLSATSLTSEQTFMYYVVKLCKLVNKRRRK